MADANDTQRCLSGKHPIALATSRVCNDGFFCPNNTNDHPPEYCPPTMECLLVRLGQQINTCDDPQGQNEPLVCPAGFYCPTDGYEKLTCPSGHFCPLGTVEPRKCGPTSACYEGAERRFQVIGCFLVLFVDVVILLSLCIPSLKRQILSKRNESGNQRELPFFSNRTNDSEVGKEDEKYGYIEKSGTGIELVEAMGRNLTLNETVEIGFKGLQVSVSSRKTPILQNVSGRVPRGSLLGIMGPSGAGKSTLIKLLAGQLRQTAGTITIDGKETDICRYKKIIGYVPQSDVLLEDLTVHENVLHSARVQLGQVKDDTAINQYVDQLLVSLGLAHVRDTVLGNAVQGRSISGGERKRVAIAMKLVAMPLILILDEPTSGLDASTALSIMSLLRSISDIGITVICSIHQPRLDIFRVLENLLLLSEGRQRYCGPTEKAQEFFEELGYIIPENTNPADAMMDIICGDDINARQFGDLKEDIEICSEPAENSLSKLDSMAEIVASRKAKWHRQAYLHFLRGLRQQPRRISNFVTEMVVGAGCGILLGLAIYNFKGHLFHGIFHEPFGLLSSAVDYTTVPQVALLSALAVGLAAAPAGVETFGGERYNFYQEVDYGHSSSAYFLGKDFSTYPRIFLSAVHFTTFYTILGTPVVSFWMLLLIHTIYFYCIYGLASLVAFVTRKENALLLALLISLVIGICNGYGPLLSQVKSWNLQWFWYLCPGTWFAEAYFSQHVEPFSYLYDVDFAARYTGYTVGRTGSDLGILLSIGVFYRVTGYICLTLPNWRLTKR